MAQSPVRYGDSGPLWGVKAETFGYMQDFDIRTITEKATVEDEKGITVVVEYFNKKWEGSFTLVDKGSATLPAFVTAGITMANGSGSGLTSGTDGPGDGGVVVYEMDRKRENKGFMKRTYTFERWDGISSVTAAVVDPGT